jgi:hypothetical protein
MIKLALPLSAVGSTFGSPSTIVEEEGGGEEGGGEEGGGEEGGGEEGGGEEGGGSLDAAASRVAYSDQ